MSDLSENRLAPVASTAVDEAAAKVTQYITFELSDYLFALPSQKILKIVATPSPKQGGLVSMGLVQLAQYSIQILDLPRILGLKPAKKSDRPSLTTNALSTTNATVNDKKTAQNPPFLMVLQNTEQNREQNSEQSPEQDLWGIAVQTPPDLMHIPDYALRPIPPKQRSTRTLQWVSHVVNYDLARDRHTLLILDLPALFSSNVRTNPANPSPQSTNLLEI
ncbi:MAG: chemotaxis protein CheW [Phormidesmis sp.]